MKKRNLLLLLACITIIVSPAATKDFIIQDSNSNELFVVNETGQKNVWNGAFDLNGNNIVGVNLLQASSGQQMIMEDSSGTDILRAKDGGNVVMPNGNVDISAGYVGLSGSRSSATGLSQFNLYTSDGNGGSEPYNKANNGILEVSNNRGLYVLDQDGNQILVGHDDGNVEIPNGNLSFTQQDSGIDTTGIRGWWQMAGGATDAVNFYDSGSSNSLLRIDTSNDEVELPSADLNMNNNHIDDIASIDGGGNAIQVNDDMNFNNNVVNNPYSVDIQGPGDGEGILWGGSNAKVVVAPLDDSNSDGYLQLVNDGGIAFEPGSDGTTEAVMESNGRLGLGTKTPQERLDVNGDARIRGDLDVWGNITNTDVQNLNVNGSILPPKEYDATFDIGSGNRRWRNAFYTGDVDVQGGRVIDSTGPLTIGDGNVEVPNGNLDINDNYLTGVNQIKAEAGRNMQIKTGSGSGSSVVLYDEANNQQILDAKEGGNVEIPNGNLDMTGGTGDVQLNQVNLQSNGVLESTRSDDNLYLDSGSGGGTVLVRNSGNSDVARFKDSGNVEIPNGKVTVSSSTNRQVVTDWTDLTAGSWTWQSFQLGGSENWRVVGINDSSNNIDMEIWDGNSNTALRIQQENQNIEVPNGDLTVNNQLTVGSTECPVGSYIDGDGSCTDVVSETSDVYVDESGDTMTGPLNITDIANFTDTGISMYQPVSIDSSGPLSVANGIDLTGTSSNTIDSYSTFYLKTSSGSPSDIVLDPTGEVGLQSNMNLGGNNVTSVSHLKMDSGVTVDENIDVSNGNLDDVNSVDGGGDSVRFDDNIDANENEIQNVDGIQDGTGTNTIHFDGSNNVEVPNGNLIVDNGNNLIAQDSNGRKIQMYHDSSNAIVDTDWGNIHFNTGDGSTPLKVINGGPVRLSSGSDLDVSSNNLDDVSNLYQDDSSTNFFASECSQGDVLIGIYSDGTYNCAASSSQVTDKWVNESGDNMTGELNVDDQIVANGLGLGTDSNTAESELADSVIYADGNIEVSQDIVGAGGDLAEKVNSSGKLEQGEVAVISGNMSLDESREPYDDAVAGVISTDPGVVLAKNRDGKNLALSGIVPVEVTVSNGEIEEGDLLTPSGTPGKAMKCNVEEKCENAVIGKAMQATDENGKINVLMTMG